jgi:ribosomal protein L11 methyltransferase
LTMIKSYIEIRLKTSVDAGELMGMLEESACLGACERDDGLCLYWPKERWHAGVLQDLLEALQLLGDLDAGSRPTVTELADQDWNEYWARSLQPIRLGERILVRQSWNSAPVPSGGFELVIDPKRAFGTGYHATTQLIASWLEELIRGGERVLDVGTGSGILAMSALRLGASSALGIDNDPEAIECSLEYAAVNGFGADLELRVAALEDLGSEQFDLVLANLDRNALLRYFAFFHKHVSAGGRLVISGLQSEDYEDIREALAKTGWRIHGRRDREEWMALELRQAPLDAAHV